MKNNWILDEAEDAAWMEKDFDDYGCGENHDVSIGDEVEASDKYGRAHAGVVVGIIRNADGVPACYKIWDGEREGFDYIPASDGIVYEPCGSSQWALERIGYEKFNPDGTHGFYLNSRTKDVIWW